MYTNTEIVTCTIFFSFKQTQHQTEITKQNYNQQNIKRTYTYYLLLFINYY